MERELPLDLAELVVDGVNVNHLERHQFLGLLVAATACMRPQRKRLTSVSDGASNPPCAGSAHAPFVDSGIGATAKLFQNIQHVGRVRLGLENAVRGTTVATMG